MYRHFWKPLIDKVVATAVLLVTLPITGVITALLVMYNAGRPFFFQLRPGLHGHLFRIVKFKTMNDCRDSKGDLLPDALRLTPVGKFIRRTSLDELPQLWNVLKGEMSLIGPRPLLPEYLALYDATQRRRHQVRPGITGWAQVNGRNTISWQQKFEYDVYYVDHVSAFLDAKIAWMTVQKVFKSEGINAVNAATIEKFTGN